MEKVGFNKFNFVNIKLCGAVNQSIKTGRIHKKRYKISKLNKI